MFSALIKQSVFILGNDKTQVPPAVLTHCERMVGEVAQLHKPALKAIAGSKNAQFIFQKQRFWSKQSICEFRLNFIAEQRRPETWKVFKSSNQNILCETKYCIQF